MRLTRRTLIGTAATSPLLAGCLGETGDGNGDAGGEADPTASPTPTEPSDDGAAVQVRSHPVLGEILVGPDGMTLYMFEPDEDGESTCYEDCAQAWPPLTVESEGAAVAGEDVPGEVGVTERDDGSLQVTVGGMPVYYFARDEEPGDATGQEVANVWFVLRPDATVVRPTVSVREHPDLGRILTDAGGTTLYMFEPDEGGESTCYEDCAQAWPPLTVESADAIVDSVRAAVELGTTERDDGSLQVTAAGWPLYYFARDEAPGDANGQGVNDVWFVLRPDGTVVRSTATPSASPTSTPTPTSAVDGSDGGGY